MSLAHLIADQTAHRPGRICETCAWVDTIDPTEARAYHDAVDLIRAGHMRQAQLWRACREYGLHVGMSAFSRHMRECGQA